MARKPRTFTAALAATVLRMPCGCHVSRCPHVRGKMRTHAHHQAGAASNAKPAAAPNSAVPASLAVPSPASCSSVSPAVREGRARGKARRESVKESGRVGTGVCVSLVGKRARERVWLWAREGLA